MADSELTDLTETTTPAVGDLLYTVVDPAGTPLDRKLSIESLIKRVGRGQVATNGSYFSGDMAGAVTTKSSITTSYLIRVFIPRAMTVDRIGLEITTNIAASTVRLAIYTDVNDVPTALVLDAGTIDSSTTGYKEITINQALNAGWVWLGCCASTGHAVVVKGSGLSTGQGYNTTGSTYSGFNVLGMSSGTWINGGAAPAGPLTPAAGTEQGPRIILRASS
jgi:hypothetical protein